MPALLEWMRSTSQTIQQTYHLLDVFGASQRMATTFQSEGFAATTYDIKLNEHHDICSSSGFMTLLELAFQLLTCISDSLQFFGSR